MKLNGVQRIALPNILPMQGSLENQLIVSDIVRKIRLSDKENEKIGVEIVEKDGVVQIRADSNKAEKHVREIEFSKSEITCMKDAVEKLSKAGKITRQNVDICKYIKDFSGEK